MSEPEDGLPDVWPRPDERPLAAVMRDAPIGMTVVDRDGRLVDANRAMCELVGRRRNELIGMSWSEVTHPEDRDVGVAQDAELCAGQRESYTIEQRYLRPDGQVRWTVTSISLVRDTRGTPTHRITQHVDITDRKRSEAKLQQTATDQAKAIEDLRRLEDAKSLFLTAVSHELRTPLTVINGLAETLTRLNQAMTPEIRQRLQDALLTNTRRMTSLLDDLLDLDQMTAGEATLESTRIDIVAHVRSVVADSTLADRTTLVAPESLLVNTDPYRVTLIVNNLFGNIVKYAPTGSVTVTLVALDGGGFRLEVQDEGPGIPLDERETVFQPFHRLAVDHPNPGTGIGLSLVARTAAWHGGDAWILDSDVGTHVVVTLPDLPLNTAAIDAPDTPSTALEHGEEAADPTGSSTGHGAVPRADVTGRILVVDDDPQIRLLLRSALVRAGHSVEVAGDAGAAHDILAQRAFDLVLLDMELPDSSGAGVASLIRADARHTATSIVFISGDTTLETKLAGFSAGGSDYLTKPISLRELLARVDAQLRDLMTFNERLQTSLRERSQLARQVLELRGGADLPTIATKLRELLQTRIPIHDLAFDLDRSASFAITGSAGRPTIRLPLSCGAGPLGTLEVTTSNTHAQEAATILSDLGPHIAMVAASELETTLDLEDARGWLEEIARPGGLTTAVQPVVELNGGTAVGYEAFARFPHGSPPDQVIAAAWRRGIGVELETLAIERHVDAARSLPPDTWLALNLSGQTLAALNPQLLGMAEREIVFELTEQKAVHDYQALRDRVATMSRTRLAVDDTGAGYASLRHIYELRPSLIKLDRTWTNGCHDDPVRQTLIRGLVELSASIGADVVAEGVEHEAQLDVLRNLGVPLGQGFLFGPPRELLPDTEAMNRGEQ